MRFLAILGLLSSLYAADVETWRTQARGLITQLQASESPVMAEMSLSILLVVDACEAHRNITVVHRISGVTDAAKREAIEALIAMQAKKVENHLDSLVSATLLAHSVAPVALHRQVREQAEAWRREWRESR